MTYLQKRAKLSFAGGFVAKRLLLATAVVCICLGLAGYYGLHRIGYGVTSAASQKQGQWSCSNGWYITGYYVPREDEMPGDAEDIYVERVGNLSFSEEFLNQT